MNICIFDDEACFQNMLNNIIEDYFDSKHPSMDYSVHCFSHITEAVDYINKNVVDIAFLDISTPDNENCGLLAARNIRTKNEKIHIVFVTSRRDKIALSFDGMVRPTDYMIKPVDKLRINELLREIVIRKAQSNNFISLKFGRSEYLICIDEIYSLQKVSHKMVVSLKNRSIEVTNTINNLIEVLPECFVQIDKGVVVNLNFASEINYSQRLIALNNGERFTMSRNARALVKESINRMMGGL